MFKYHAKLTLEQRETLTAKVKRSFKSNAEVLGYKVFTKTHKDGTTQDYKVKVYQPSPAKGYDPENQFKGYPRFSDTPLITLHKGVRDSY